MANWDKAYKNTKMFRIPSKYSTGGEAIVEGCRNCDEVVELENLHNYRQLIGNAYQTIGNCKKCGAMLVVLEDNEIIIENYLKEQ